MSIWHFVEADDKGDDIVYRITDDEILARHWVWWSAKMRAIGRPASLITERHCIEDFAVTHWAERLDTADEAER